jgi:hypothetical protein
VLFSGKHIASRRETGLLIPSVLVALRGPSAFGFVAFLGAVVAFFALVVFLFDWA